MNIMRGQVLAFRFPCRFRCVAIFVLIAIVGCLGLVLAALKGNIAGLGFNIRRDADADSPCWGGYALNARYKLMQDCFLAEVDDGLEGKRCVLLPEGALWFPTRRYPAPASIAQWQTKYSNEWQFSSVKILGVVANGIHLECKRLRINKGWSIWSGRHCVFTIYAKIIDGQFTGQIVDVSDVSIPVHDRASSRPNPAILKTITRNGVRSNDNSLSDGTS